MPDIFSMSWSAVLARFQAPEPKFCVTSSAQMAPDPVTSPANLISSNNHPIGTRMISLECWRPGLSNHVKKFANYYARYFFDVVELRLRSIPSTGAEILRDVLRPEAPDSVTSPANRISSNIHPIRARMIWLECWRPELSNHVKKFANYDARKKKKKIRRRGALSWLDSRSPWPCDMDEKFFCCPRTMYCTLAFTSPYSAEVHRPTPCFLCHLCLAPF